MFKYNLITSTNGGNIINNPIAIARIELIKVAAAQISLIFFALILYSNDNKSTKFSTIVLINSNPMTIPIVNNKIAH